MPATDIVDYFDFEPAGRTIGDLDTPMPVVDIDVVDRNIRRWQRQCDRLGILNRPHIKTHKLTGLARFQLAVGAVGITVQKLGEAEIMAAAGISDMLLTFNVVGATKLRRLAALARCTDIKVVADSPEVVAGLGEAGIGASRPIAVLVECDTGGGRNGVQSPAAAAGLARTIDATSGIFYGGLMTYPAPGAREATRAFFEEARTLAAAAGLSTTTVSTGGSVDMWDESGLEGGYEYRAGTYVYCDRYLVSHGAASAQDCALTVLATVVSRPVRERVILDAGSKALTSDLLGLEGYGVVPELNGAIVRQVNEEHGIVEVPKEINVDVGERLRITPNHVCPVSNLFDRVVFVRGDEVLGAVRVNARGAVQ